MATTKKTSTTKKLSALEILTQSTHSFDIMDLAMFETYQFVIGLLMLILFPIVATVSIWIYIAIIALGLWVMIQRLTRKKGDTLYRVYRKEKCLHIMERLSMWHVSVYKIICILSGIVVGMIFPGLVSGALWIYVLIAGFGAGYFIDHLKNYFKNRKRREG